MVLGALFALLAWTAPTPARETERLFLSGTGYDDAVPWEFFVTEGRRSGEWTTIPVPSQWELHGFGSYNYGHDEDKSREEGHYRHRFQVPPTWRDRTVELVFEGSMTDTETTVNGQPAGPVHQGGFYRFRYDVTERLDFEGENLLEVTVRKHSRDRKVNLAERDADYWIFGGIFRPVYLEASPRERIAGAAIDARADGTFKLRAELAGLTAPARLTVRLAALDGEAVGDPFSVDVGTGGSTASLESKVSAPRLWSAESPHLHHAVLELERAGTVLHRRAERFGFRTLEVRPDEGLFVNGRRVLLKGVNRHAFWPDSGRTLSRELDTRDAALMKRLNLNAYRASHYPPDTSFLEACDELGIYVIDELAGWHDAYGTAVGRKLVREMVERDRNHPSILFWANGNEGGWNTALDDEFSRHDAQHRPVLHPDEVAGGFDTKHYLRWSELESSLDSESLRNRWRSLWGELPLVMPTELLHGLYDGGSGAGLEDYWERLRASPRGAGAFLWSFVDEAVARTDRGGELDTDGNHAPDGLLGPYRELSANYYAVRHVFSPIRVEEKRFDGILTAENRFDETDLKDCRFRWRLLDLPEPGEPEGPEELARGEIDGPPTPPGGRGELALGLPERWRDASALELEALDPHGWDVRTWVLPIGKPWKPVPSPGAGERRVAVVQEGHLLTLRSATTGAVFDLRRGELRSLERGGRSLPFGGGPRPAGPWPPVPRTVRHFPRGASHVVDVVYARGLRSARWEFHPSGWLRLDYSYAADPGRPTERAFHGVRLELPEDKVERVRWLGDGPGRVWKNRLGGGILGVWEKETATSTPPTAAHEPKLPGFYSGVRWAEIVTEDGELWIVPESPGLFLGFLSPRFPEDSKDAVAEAPPAGLSILHGVPPIGTKFRTPDELGPQSRKHELTGTYRGVVWFYVGPIGRRG